MVQYAQGINSNRAYSIKFCVIPSSFNVERLLYADPALKESLPRVADMCPNEDGAAVDARGHPLPPCIVMERGESLDEWAIRCEPETPLTIEVCQPSMHMLHCRDIRTCYRGCLSRNCHFLLHDK